MARSSSGTVMGADSSGALWILWHFDSDIFGFNWYAAPVGNAVANAGDPAMTRSSDGSEIASTGYDGSLWFYWITDGNPAWSSSEVAGPPWSRAHRRWRSPA